MTRNEHMLLLTIFTKQQQVIHALADILKSHGLASGDDLRAFEFAATQDTPAMRALLDSVKSFYVEAAHTLKVETGLESL